MEDIIKTITTKKGARVSLVQPQGGRPFFRYEAGANAITDTFRYLIRQHGQEDTATVTVNVEVPVEENTAQDYFNQQANGFIKCMEKFMDGSTATKALFNMLGIDEGLTLNNEWMDEVFQNFNFFDYATAEGQPFIFEEHAARYVYMKEGYWDMMPGNDTIEIIFPSSRESLDNDAVLEVRDYKYTEVKTEDGLNFFPTHVAVQLRIKEQPYFSFALNGKQSETETEYHEGSGFPIAFDARLSIEPYNLELLMKNDSGKILYPSISLRDTDGCKVGMDAEIHLQDELHSDIRSEQIHVENVNLYVNELTFRGLETFWVANQTKAETQEAIDSIIKITCEYQGEIIGQVRFLLEEEAVMLEYQDGTSQNLNELVLKFMDDYFNNPKPDGSERNNAFEMADGHYPGADSQSKSVDESAGKMGAKLSEGMRRRASKSNVNTDKIAEFIGRFFSGGNKEEYDHSPYGDDYYYHAQEEEMRRQEEEERKRREEEEHRLKEEEEQRLREAEEKEISDRKAKEAADAKKAKDLADARKAKALEEEKLAKAAADKKIKDAADAKKAKDLADARKAKELEEEKLAKAAANKKIKDAADVKKAKDLADAKRAKELEEEKLAKAAADKKIKDAADAKQAKDIAGTKDFTEVKEVKDLSDVKKAADFKDANLGGKTKGS